MKKLKLPLVLSAVLLAAILGGTGYYFFIREDTYKTCTTYGNAVPKQCAEDYIGLTDEQAFARAKKYEYTPKIAILDGVPQANTDERDAIIWLEIEKGTVTRAYFSE